MEIKYSKEMQFALQEAKNLAVQYQSPSVGVEHITIGILKYDPVSEIKRYFQLYKIDINNLTGRLKDMLAEIENKIDVSVDDMKVNIQADNTLRLSYLLSKEFRSDEVEAQHFILAEIGRAHV